jgi:hypothetical protein
MVETPIILRIFGVSLSLSREMLGYYLNGAMNATFVIFSYSLFLMVNQSYFLQYVPYISSDADRIHD